MLSFYGTHPPMTEHRRSATREAFPSISKRICFSSFFFNLLASLKREKVQHFHVNYGLNMRTSRTISCSLAFLCVYLFERESVYFSTDKQSFLFSSKIDGNVYFSVPHTPLICFRHILVGFRCIPSMCIAQHTWPGEITSIFRNDYSAICDTIDAIIFMLRRDACYLVIEIIA